MKTFLFIFSLFFISGPVLFAQNAVDITANETQYEVLFSLLSPEEATFYEVIDYLENQQYVDVIQSCSRLKQIYVRVDVRGFKNETLFIKTIETTFPGSSYYKKDSSEKSLNQFYSECREEIIKGN